MGSSLFRASIRALSDELFTFFTIASRTSKVATSEQTSDMMISLASSASALKSLLLADILRKVTTNGLRGGNSKGFKMCQKMCP